MVIDGGGPGRKGGRAPTRRGPRMEEPRTLIRLPEDPYAGAVPRRGGRGRGVLALAVLTVVVAAAITLSNGRHRKAEQTAVAGVGGGVPGQNSSVASSTPTGQPTAQTPDAAPNPTKQYTDTAFPGLVQGGVLVGYPDTKSGAEAAAANYVSAYGSEDMLHPDTRRKVIQTIADPAIQSTLQTELDQAFSTVDENLGLDKYGNAPKGFTVVSRSFALGVQVISYTNSRATVSIWTNSLLGTAGSASTHPVVEDWSTITLDLTWVKGDWKWHSFSAAEGPTPVSSQAASTGEALQTAAQQFARLRYAP